MPLGDDHYEPAVVQADTTTKTKKTETSTVAGGKAPSGYVDTFVREVPKAAQKAANAVGNAIVSAVDPRHFNDQGEVDWAATGVHTAADLAALKLAEAGLKSAVAPNPLASQNETMLKIAKMEAQTAAQQRAHELELAKLKAAGVVQTAPTTAAPTTTTPTPTAPAPTPTPTLAQINAVSATPTTVAPSTTVAPPAGVPPVAIAPAAPVAPIPSPEVPTVPLTTEVGKAPKEMPMVEQAAGNPEKNALAEERKTQPAPVKKAPAAPQKQTFKSIAEVPEGVVFKEGWGGADSWLNDQVGKEKAKVIRNTFNQGRGFGSGADAIKNAATALGEFGNTQFMTQGEPLILSKENRQRFGIAPPPQSGALNKTFPKAVKIAGAAGLLLTGAEAANAKNARQAAGTVAESFLPIGLTPRQLESGTLTEKQLNAFKEAQKLGSPYRSVPPPR
jgi:hypothetical protein